MDTIIYLSYTQQNDTAFCSYELAEHIPGDYRLIKIRIRENSQRRRKISIFDIGGRLRQCRYRRQTERTRQRMSRALKQEVAGLLQEYAENLLCYDESVPKESWVRELLPLQEFQDYTDYRWAKQLLPEAVCHDFVALGDDACLRQILWDLAPCMKSLWWIAPDVEAEEALEDFGEAFYQETGLAVRLQFLCPGTTYGQLKLPESSLKEPVNILDFTKGRHIPQFYPPKGSVWLDMFSGEEKERRIHARSLCCKTVSLRKQWKNL